jgi:hypothetical protein
MGASANRMMLQSAVWLAPDESDYITGISLFSDGG